MPQTSGSSATTGWESTLGMSSSFNGAMYMTTRSITTEAKHLNEARLKEKTPCFLMIE